MKRFLVSAVTAILAGAVFAADSAALTIIANFVAAGQPLPGIGTAGVGADNSTGGGNLTDIFAAAANEWERVIRDDFTLILSYGWYSTSPVSGTAFHQGLSAGGTPSRELSGSIAFNNMDANFFLDPTPGDDSEFGLISETEIDLGAGPLIAKREHAPATDAASGRVDLFSTALHEIGHALGLTGWGFYDAETADGKIDVMQTVYSGTQIPVASSHIDLAGPVMSNRGRPLGHRRKITQVDLLAVCQVSGFEQCAVTVGDYDFDGDVDAADFSTWKLSYGSTEMLAADGNGNGIIDAGDYTIWRDQFANGAATTVEAVHENHAVPEPTSYFLFLLGAVWNAAVGRPWHDCLRRRDARSRAR